MYELPRRALLAGLSSSFLFASTALAQTDPLPSWNNGAAKSAILSYVAKVTADAPGSVPPEDRIAVFDNDGTLWAEQPLYFQFLFAADRIGKLVARDPSLRSKPAFAAIADRDVATLSKLSQKELLDAIAASQAGLTPYEYTVAVKHWLAEARHPKFNVRYTSLVYQPQLELLEYLRRSGFRTYIVSGGDIRFMRAFAEDVYGIPPEQVIGTSQPTHFELRNGQPVLVAQNSFENIDDGPAKPENIDLHIGRVPLIAVGNSDGDLEMLQYSASGNNPALQLLIHHDDAEREYAYDRQSRVGKLDKALDAAKQWNFTVVSMKTDWNTIFPKSANP